jgi:hypothetical protein
MKIVEYLAANGASLFRKWLDGLDSFAVAKITTTLVRLGLDTKRMWKASAVGFMKEISITAPASASISAWMARN